MANQTDFLNTLSMGTSFKTQLDPSYAKQTLEVETAIVQATPKKAIALAQRHVERYPKDAQANYLLATAYVRSNLDKPTLHFAQIAHKLNPANTDYICFLGRIYLKLKLYEYAAPLLFKAMKEQPDDFRVNWAMAEFQFVIGNGLETKRLYEHTLTLKASRDIKLLLTYKYATCLSSLSLIEEADKAYSEYGSQEEHAATAISRRSRLRKYKPDSEMAKLVIEKIEDIKVENSIKKELLLSLGVMHENAGDYDKAFELWTKAQEFNSENLLNQFNQKETARVGQFYSKQLFNAARPYGHSSSKPLFVVGMPRSGTTLIEQVLGAHASCHGAGELSRMDSLEFGFRSTYEKPNHIEAIVENAKKNELRLRAEETLGLLGKLAGPTVQYVIDKTPTHYVTMGISALYFPNAKFIHTQRHPADSFISAFQNNMNESHSYSYDQESYAEAYLAKEKLMAHWRDCFPKQIYDLQYERLVARPEETVRDVLEFLNLPWDENCMQFFNKGKTVKTFSKDQVRSPIYTTSVHRWKNYEKHLGPLFAALKAANFEYPEV